MKSLAKVGMALALISILGAFAVGLYYMVLAIWSEHFGR